MKQLLNNDGVQIAIDKREPCISHKSIADTLGVEHRAIMQLINAYESDFETFGKVTFQMLPLTSGQRERIALAGERAQPRRISPPSRSGQRVII